MQLTTELRWQGSLNILNLLAYNKILILREAFFWWKAVIFSLASYQFYRVFIYNLCFNCLICISGLDSKLFTPSELW